MSWLDSFSSFHSTDELAVKSTRKKGKFLGAREEQHSVQQIIDTMFGMATRRGEKASNESCKKLGVEALLKESVGTEQIQEVTTPNGEDDTPKEVEEETKTPTEPTTPKESEPINNAEEKIQNSDDSRPNSEELGIADQISLEVTEAITQAEEDAALLRELLTQRGAPTLPSSLPFFGPYPMADGDEPVGNEHGTMIDPLISPRNVVDVSFTAPSDAEDEPRGADPGPEDDSANPGPDAVIPFITAAEYESDDDTNAATVARLQRLMEAVKLRAEREESGE